FGWLFFGLVVRVFVIFSVVFCVVGRIVTVVFRTIVWGFIVVNAFAIAWLIFFVGFSAFVFVVNRTGFVFCRFCRSFIFFLLLFFGRFLFGLFSFFFSFCAFYKISCECC